MQAIPTHVLVSSQCPSALDLVIASVDEPHTLISVVHVGVKTDQQLTAEAQYSLVYVLRWQAASQAGTISIPKYLVVGSTRIDIPRNPAK